MAIHQIIKMGNPILRKVSRELTKEEILSDEIKNLIEDMWQTMEDAGGLGLAAPQIAIPVQLTVIRIPPDSQRYPKSDKSDKFIIFNPKHIKVDYLDRNAIEQTIELTGFLATVFQHEIDHLIGKIYVDQMKDISTLTYEDEMLENHQD